MTKYQRMLKAYYSRDTFCGYSPLHIYIEPTNVCNLSCSHCPQRTMKRERGFMDLKLYERIIKECEDMGVTWVYLFHVGESTLHKEITSMIEIARERGIKVRLHTNGTQDVSNSAVDELRISANETDFGEIKPNIDRLIARRISFKIDAIKGISNIPEKGVYRKFVKAKDFYNWQGAIGKSMSSDMQTICSHLYKSMCVLWDGRCVACCVDYDAGYVIGDVREKHLREIWNSPKMRHIREKPVEMCRFCNLERIPEEERF